MSAAVAEPVDVVLAPEPFSTRVERLEAREGCTVAEILTEACRLEVLDPADLARAEVYLDGVRLVDRAAALDIVPAPGQLLNVTVLPAGGGGGGNKIVTTILEVALLAATAWIAGPGGAALGNSIAGATGATVGSAAFTAVSAAVRLGAIVAITAGGSALLPMTSPRAGDNFWSFG